MKIILAILILSILPLATQASFDSYFKKLKDHYPNQSENVLKKRIQNAKDQFNFFRSFPPLYYDLNKVETYNDPKLLKLSKLQAFLIGDAHFLNFGTVYKDLGEESVIYAANDQDDGGKAPIIYDLIRYITSINLVNNQFNNRFYIDTQGLIDAYIESFGLGEIEFDSLITNFIEKSMYKNFPSKKWVNYKEEKFSKRKENSFDLSDQLKDTIKSFVINEFGAKAIDFYGEFRMNGGSGGKVRFHTLIKLPDGRIQWLELKELSSKPSTSVISNTTIQDPISRFYQSIKYHYGQQLNILKTFKYKSKSFLTRFRLKGNDEIDVKDLNSSEFSLVTKNHMSLMAKIHARSFKQSEIPEIKKQLNDLKSVNWNAALELSLKNTKDAFDSLKK